MRPTRPGTSAARATLLLVALAASAAGCAAGDAGARDHRIEWWREARFGIFVHWGLYAQPAGDWQGTTCPGPSEWLMNSARLSVADYEPLRDRFDPVRFDARAWVSLFKAAGAGYVVITSKHHDGFGLWDSDCGDWNVGHTPFGRDVLAELSQACREQGLRLGFYHSILDWHHPDYLPRRAGDDRPAEGARFERYVAYLHAQLRELLTRYGPIGVLWFDGEWEERWTHELGQELYGFVRGLQPDILVNNRVDKGRDGMAGLTQAGGFAGDFGTPEQEVPARGLPGTDWESCVTMNDSWGWKRSDEHWKSPAELVGLLVETASKGGNLLLNVGPTAEGLIPDASVERLAAIGRWMDENGASIRGTVGSPFRRLRWPCTVAGSRLYVHLTEWPGGTLDLPGLRNDVAAAWLLADRGRPGVTAVRTAGGVAVSLPGTPPDLLDSVLVLELDGAPDVAEPLPGPTADGRLLLAARDADVAGRAARYERARDCIGYWTDPHDAVSWEFRPAAAGRFRVEVEQACVQQAAGARYKLSVADSELHGTVAATESWSDFVTVGLGEVSLPAAPSLVLTVRPEAMPGFAVMNLRAVRLLPVP